MHYLILITAQGARKRVFRVGLAPYSRKVVRGVQQLVQFGEVPRVEICAPRGHARFNRLGLRAAHPGAQNKDSGELPAGAVDRSCGVHHMK